MTRKHKPKQWKAWGVFDGDGLPLIKRTRDEARNVAELRHMIHRRRFPVRPVTITLSAPKRPATRKK